MLTFSQINKKMYNPYKYSVKYAYTVANNPNGFIVAHFYTHVHAWNRLCLFVSSELTKEKYISQDALWHQGKSLPVHKPRYQIFNEKELPSDDTVSIIR